MNNQGIQSLRVPAAWALLGAVAAQMLGGLINIFGTGGRYESGPAYTLSSSGASDFFGPVIVALILGAVFLVITGPQKSAAFPVVLTALIMSGIGALMGVISLIMGFVAGSDMGQLAYGFSNFFETAGFLAILVFAGLFLVKLLGDQNLVPRAAPAPAMGQPGPPHGYPPQTGAQQSFAPQTGAQQAFPQADWAAAQGYADPNQSYADLGYQQGYADPNQSYADLGYQQGYADPNQSYADLGYQQGYADPNQSYADLGYQQGYADPNQSYADLRYQQQGYAQPSGAQPAYGQDWQYQQQGYGGQGWPADQQMPYAGQPGYTSGGQPAGYDAYASYGNYGTGGQPVYGDQSAYGTGGQPVYGDQSAYGTGGQPVYGDQSAYGTGGQPAYDMGTGGQAPYGAAYEPSSYASQGGDPAQSGDQAAQDAIQYGWYQQPVDPGDERYDTPMEQFFSPEEQASPEAAHHPDPGYAHYGTGAAYGENYPADQQGHGESGEGQQPWYRDDDRR